MFQRQFLRPIQDILAVGGRLIVHVFLVTMIIAVLPISSNAKYSKVLDHSNNWATANDFGSVGLLQARTARFRDDGDFSVGTTILDPYLRYYISFQAMPWLEGTFRYTEITNRSFSIGGLASTEDYQDRGADLKFLLLDEGRMIPQIAFGLQDGIGTGLFSGEYLVASKSYYDFDFSFGLGWGYLASGSSIKNPLITFNDVFSRRDSSGGLGGEANFGDYLSGPNIGVFGGMEWRTPLKGLSLKLEASTQDYQSEPLGNTFKRDLPINFGFVYHPLPWLEISGAYERGNIAMFRAAIRANVNDSSLPKVDPPPPKLKPRKSVSQNRFNLPDTAPRGDASFGLLPRLATHVVHPGDPVKFRPKRSIAVNAKRSESITEALFSGFEARAMQISSVETNADEVRIYLATGLRSSSPERQLEAARLAAALPSDGNRITLVERRNGINIHQVTMTRDEIKNRILFDNLFDNLEAKGFKIDSMDISHVRARLVMTHVPELDGDVEHAAANIIFNAAPTSLQQVEIVQMDKGRQRSRAVVRRRDVRRTAMIDRIFDGLETSGYSVGSLDLSKGIIRVHLSDALEGKSDGHQAKSEAAAQLVADHAPDGVSSVEIVRISAGVETARVTLKRTAAGELTAGTSSKSEPSDGFIPSLTDNEKNDIALKIFKGLEAANFTVDKFEISRRKATVFVTPTKFREHARNVGRASRVVASHAPDSIEEIEIVTMNAGLETARVSIMRRDLEAGVQGNSSPEEIWAHTVVSGPKASPPFAGDVAEGVTAISNPLRYPTLSWEVRPALKSHIGGPDALYLYQIWLAFSASAELYRGLSFGATFGKNIKSTLDEITLVSDSLLPKVRSDLRLYHQEGEDGNIVRMQTDYLFQPAEEWFGRVSAGLFETMFGGIGGEIMYRPYGSRLALSLDVNRVQQRDFDQRLDFLDYKVTTGHLNIYYKIPFMGLLGEIHAGQFLAGDRGAQFAVVREFDSGMAVGAWATFTNVSPEEFGEGSFDKGLYMRIPFELFLATSSLRAGSLSFRPLSRDGGQLLRQQNRLYGIVERGNLDTAVHRWDQFLN